MLAEVKPVIDSELIPGIETIFEWDSAWKFAPEEIDRCFRPNHMAYHKKTAALALVVIGGRCDDFTINEGAVDEVSAALRNGKKENGDPVEEVVVVFAVRDDENPPLTSWRSLKIFKVENLDKVCGWMGAAQNELVLSYDLVSGDW